jgi:NAD(P)-dependent dehydrogenase (short-subunit alcohol dehydrogenase family)
MTEPISLAGKVAVVTGAGRGLGRAYVELLAERGAQVVVNDLGTDVSGFGKDSTIAKQVAELIRSRGGEAIANDSDVSSPESGSDPHRDDHRAFRQNRSSREQRCKGRLAAFRRTAPWEDHPRDVGHGLFGLRGQATYAAAKCEVVGLMRILAIEGASMGFS